MLISSSFRSIEICCPISLSLHILRFSLPKRKVFINHRLCRVFFRLCSGVHGNTKFAIVLRRFHDGKSVRLSEEVKP
jgi:hypothetical protein